MSEIIIETFRPRSGNSPYLLELNNIEKSFMQGKERLEILKDINLTINMGETVALLGPSGCGKSTLLNIAGLLERADKGKLLLSGHDCSKIPDKEQALFRREFLGFVYQNHNLLPEFSALENVMIPQLIANEDKSTAKKRAIWLLEMLGLKHRIKHRPSELSGGEQQRVAIARALANRPRLLLADEPTGNLDVKTSESVFDSLIGIIKETGLSAFIVTHNPELALKMDRRFTLQNGKLVELIAKGTL